MTKAKQTAWDCALRYLGQRNHGSAELRTKLSRRGFDVEEVNLAMDRLLAADLLDDQAFASEYARSLMLSKRLSKRAAAAKMRDRELATDVIAGALAEYSDEDELGCAVEIARQRLQQMSGVSAIAAKRRLLAYLARRGYSQSVCYQAMEIAADD